MAQTATRLTWPGVLAWRLNERQCLDRRASRDEALGVCSCSYPNVTSGSDQQPCSFEKTRLRYTMGAATKRGQV